MQDAVPCMLLTVLIEETGLQVLRLNFSVFLFFVFGIHEVCCKDDECFSSPRRQWDAFLVPDTFPGASRIPDGFVTPVEPSSDLWATAIIDKG